MSSAAVPSINLSVSDVDIRTERKRFVQWRRSGRAEPTRGVVLKRSRIIILVVMLASTLIPAAPVQAQTSPATVTFFGGGFGHAVGMSQFGANALAAEGKTRSEIVQAYYGPSVSIQDHTALAAYPSPHPLASADPNIWVGLRRDVTSLTFLVPSDGGGTVGLCQLNDDQGDSCPRADAVPMPGDTWKMVRLGSTTTRCQFSRVAPNPVDFPAGDCSASISWGGSGQSEYITVDDNNTDYRDGTLRIRQGITQKQSGDFHVSLDIPIEEYLLGLREVPLSWNTAALRTQVVAGRSYALEKFARFYDANSTALSGYLTTETSTPLRMSACACHIYDSIVDQNYRGMDNEQKNASTYGAWAEAVGFTAREVVTYGGKLIQAFYSSSTGGNTENSEHVFSSPLPYAQSVEDPWSQTSANPNATWTKTVPIETVRQAINFGTSFDTITDITLANPAPNAQMIVTGTKDGIVKTGEYSIGRRYGKLSLLSPSVSGITFNPYGGESPYAFTDISESVHWMDINEIAERGITLGCNPPANTLFCPTREVTRGQMAAFLTRTLGLVERAPDPFGDDDGHLFEADIERIAAAGITLGCNPPANDRFCPDRKVTRGQMAAFLSRAYELVDRAPDPFNDDDGTLFEADIERIAAAGITLGCNPPANDRFCADNIVLRQQMASFLIRAISYAGG